MNKLFIVSTPIGNLGDITYRAIDVLKNTKVVFAEDTRRSSKLFFHYGITTPLKRYHEHNVDKAIPEVINYLKMGDVALISDSGTPLVSDPGFKLVRKIKDLGHPVISIPGASAVLASLVVSGLPTDKFSFRGFLPKKSSQIIREMEYIKDRDETTIYFESPYRINKTLALIMNVLGDNRVICVCRELTKLHEEIFLGNVAEIKKEFISRNPKGEYVVLIAKSDYEG
jgi:16S rRNA (cytidine1402-2'-O)-methyltransferase